jgi:hypothetical protein
MTDKWQTRPLVREGAPYGQDYGAQDSDSSVAVQLWAVNCEVKGREK